MSFESLKQLGMLRMPMPWHRGELCGDGEELVICIHGLWRSKWAMQPLARKLVSAGYTTYNLVYSSFKESLSEMSERLGEVLRTHAGGYKKVHFVTHSLGGVITRRYLSESVPENCGRVLMVAPPLQGSKIVDWLEDSPLRRTLGPAGKFLSTKEMAREPKEMPVQTGVIMGNKVKIPLLHHVIGEASDGIVRVNAGKIEGLSEFRVVHADHTFITADPEVLEIAPRFLRTGKF